MNVHTFTVDLLLALSDVDDVTQDFLFLYFLFIGIYDICLFNSTHILKAIKTCNIYFYLTNNE